MSSISSISAGSGLSQFLQSLSSSTASPTSPVAPTDAATAPTSADALTSDQNSLTPVAGHHHHGGGGKGGGGEFFSRIQSAVTSALQNAQGDTSADPNSIIENAIAGVFQESNPPGAAPASGLATDPSSSTTSTTTAGATSSAYQNFLQTLQANGVDAQQFHQDFLNAVQQAQNGQSNPANAFQNWPLGSALDTIA